MQTITKKREIKKWVSAGFEDEKIFITEDGLEFADKKEAQRHEGKIISEKSFTTKYNVLHKKKIDNMTRKEFEKIPPRKNWHDPVEFDALIILPTRHMHDSGFRCLDFVAVKSDKPVCRLSGCSDVLHINGIGGYGDRLAKFGSVPREMPILSWNMDCLPKSGLLRLWCDGHVLIDRGALSSFEVLAKGVVGTNVSLMLGKILEEKHLLPLLLHIDPELDRILAEKMNGKDPGC